MADGTSRAGPLSAINGTMPQWQAAAEKNAVVDFVDYCLRGVGQVCFLNNPVTGLFIVVATFVADDWLGVAGLIGLVASTLAALVLGFDRGAIRAGLYGFNGILVGLALATFLDGRYNATVIGWIVGVSIFSTVLMAALATVFLTAWKVPPFTLAFNFATLIFLVAALNLANGHFAGVIEPASPAFTGDQVQTSLGAVSPDNDFVDFLTALFNGIGQLFFAKDVIAGILIIVGLAVASRIAAGFALVGSATGLVTGLALGASGQAIYDGLWGFNSFDAALAVAGVFFVLTWRSALTGVACAIAAALLFGALGSLFTPWGLPALTLPFCFATLAFVLLKGVSSRLVPVEVQDITTPEEHLHRMRGEHSAGVGRDAVGAL